MCVIGGCFGGFFFGFDFVPFWNFFLFVVCLLFGVFLGGASFLLLFPCFLFFLVEGGEMVVCIIIIIIR